MKKFLAGILVILMVLSLTACGNKSETTPGEGSEKTYKKHLNISLSGTVALINPQAVSSTPNDTVYKMVYNQLISYNADTKKIEPELADSWDQEGIKTFTFHLHEGVLFSNGEELKADDVVFTFTELGELTGDISLVKVVTDNIESVEALDDYTVRFVLKNGDADFLYRMYLVNYTIFNRKACEENIEDGVYVGTNGWIITEFVPAERVEFKRFDDSWVWNKDGINPTETVSMIMKDEASTRAIAVQTGQDAATTGIALTDVSSLESDPNVETIVYNSEFVYYLFFNMKDSPIAQDENVRMAVAYALNFDECSAVMFNGLAERTYTLWSKNQFGYYNDFSNKVDYNLEKAKEYMAKSNYPDGCKVKFVYHNSNQATLVATIQQQLKKIGIEAEITGTDLTGMTNMFKTEGSYDMGYSGISLQTIGDRFYFIGKDNVTTNRAKYIDPYMQELFDKARAEEDDEARKAIYKEIQEILNDVKAYIPIYYGVEATAYHKGVSGIGFSSDGKFDFSMIRWEE